MSYWLKIKMYLPNWFIWEMTWTSNIIMPYYYYSIKTILKDNNTSCQIIKYI